MRKSARSREVFYKSLDGRERKLVARLDSPAAVQAFLDGLPYSPGSRYRSPLSVLRDRTAHCYDGAVFAAAMMESFGFPPLIVNMFPNSRDDEHLVALFRRHGAWGAVGKSNFVGLRYREPIHRTLRELMLSYFEDFFNIKGEKTLRSYTRPCDLSWHDASSWMTVDAAMEEIAQRLSSMRRYPLLTRPMIRGLSPLDKRSYTAGLLGSLAAGLYKV